MVYSKFHDPWENEPSENTPITAAALDHIEQGIDDAHQAVDDIATGTAQMLEEGVDQTPRLWTAEQIHDEIARQIAEAL